MALFKSKNLFVSSWLYAWNILEKEKPSLGAYPLSLAGSLETWWFAHVPREQHFLGFRFRTQVIEKKGKIPVTGRYCTNRQGRFAELLHLQLAGCVVSGVEEAKIKLRVILYKFFKKRLHS